MPELPEVETVCIGLSREMKGRAIVDAAINRPDIRFPIPENLCQNLKNKYVSDVTRRAKYIFIQTKPKGVLMIHLGMSGRISFHDKGHYIPGKHDHFTASLDNGRLMVFTDPRRFGVLDYCHDMKAVKEHRLIKNLGIEPLEKHVDGAAFYQITQKSKAPIKNVIMNARLVVGVGNIYACESLHMAGIHPETASSRLTHEQCHALAIAIKTVLKKAIKAGGSSLRDYVAADGTLGRFQHGFTVYGREGKPCPTKTCNGHIERIVQQGRSTFYCSICQKRA